MNHPSQQAGKQARLLVWCLGVCWLFRSLSQLDPTWSWQTIALGLSGIAGLAACFFAGHLAEQAILGIGTSWTIQPKPIITESVSTSKPDPEPILPQPSADVYDDAVKIQEAIQKREFAKAMELAQAWIDRDPNHAHAQQTMVEAQQAKVAEVEYLRLRVTAAKEAQDADQVLLYRAELHPLLESNEKEEFDKSVLQWLMQLFQNRLRRGAIGPDIAAIATQVAEVFGHYPEGASMKAGLPVLRRSAGLCPRCSQPYRGVENACPQCQASLAKAKLQTTEPPKVTPETPPNDPEPDLEEIREDDAFFDNKE